MDGIKADRSTEPLVGVRSAAEFLGMSKLTVRRMAHARQLPAIAFPYSSGKHTYRFRMSELESYVNSLRRAPQETTV